MLILRVALSGMNGNNLKSSLDLLRELILSIPVP
jgi:hypothetical protein